MPPSRSAFHDLKTAFGGAPAAPALPAARPAAGAGKAQAWVEPTGSLAAWVARVGVAHNSIVDKAPFRPAPLPLAGCGPVAKVIVPAPKDVPLSRADGLPRSVIL